MNDDEEDEPSIVYLYSKGPNAYDSEAEAWATGLTPQHNSYEEEWN